MIRPHRPTPGPGYWDWRCLRCSEAVREHPSWWHLLRQHVADWRKARRHKITPPALWETDAWMRLAVPHHDAHNCPLDNCEQCLRHYLMGGCERCEPTRRASAFKPLSIPHPPGDHDPASHWFTGACPACFRSPSATTADEPTSSLPDAKGQEPA